MISRFLRHLLGQSEQTSRVETPTTPPPGTWALDLLTGAHEPVDPAPAMPPKPEDVRLWAPQMHGGSSEHYFHFMLGLVMPLLLDPDTKEGVRTLVKSCGPLDGLLTELDLPGVTVLPKAAWTDLRKARAHRAQEDLGFDAPPRYDAEIFARFRRAVFERLGVDETAPNGDVLIVDRGESPAFYQSDLVDTPTSAKLRRSVPNMAAIRDGLIANAMPCVTTELENASLRDQVDMFLRAHTLVAQHGAALLNMIWMKPGGEVIEILPPMGQFTDYFKELAAVCGHAYAVVEQRNHHAPVDVQAVLDVMKRARVTDCATTPPGAP